jgi:hypothetical protein
MTHHAGNRERMEALLQRDELRVLYAQCRACGVPRDAWHLSPQVAPAWEMLCIDVREGQLRDEARQRGREMSVRSARMEAAAHLGLEWSTLRKRLSRAGRHVQTT